MNDSVSLQYNSLLDSSDLLNDAAAIRTRAESDGYLFFRGLLPSKVIFNLRKAILTVSKRHGWLATGRDLMAGIARIGPAYTDGQSEEWFKHYRDLMRIRDLHALGWRRELAEVVRCVVAKEFLIHSCVVCRVVFPGTGLFGKPPHQDIRFVRGEMTWAAWIPIGNCPINLGGVAVLRGSHKHGILPITTLEWGAAADEPRGCEWLASDMTTGDVLFFSNLTVHKSLPNVSEKELRLSIDLRFQPTNEVVGYESLMPFGRSMTWDEVYESWDDDDPLRYYWRKMDIKIA